MSKYKFKNVLKKLQKVYRVVKYQLFNKHNEKVFVIGFNKTGTTSVKKSLEDLGFLVGNQRTAELLLDDIIQGNLFKLIAYCKTAEAFQDIPFSCPKIYQVLDREFPNSKFILTIRNDPEQWYNSLVNFHSNLFRTKTIPTYFDLYSALIVYPGWSLKCMKYIFGDLPLYSKKEYMKVYENHNCDVISYFRDRPNDLLVLNVSSKGAYQKFCNFLGKEPVYETFPWINKT